MRTGCDTPTSTSPPTKVPPTLRGKGHDAYYQRMPLKATLDHLDGEDEAGRLEPRKDLEPWPWDKEDEESQRQYPEEEEGS